MNTFSRKHMGWRWGIGILLSGWLLMGCQGPASPPPTAPDTLRPPSTPEEQGAIETDEGESWVEGSQLIEGEHLLGLSDLKDISYGASDLPNVKNPYFVTSGNCVMCHKDMVDQDGKDVSTDILWRAAMMANASRDPYWQATVKSQILHVPGLDGVIEDKCSTCHMPLAQFSTAQEDEEGYIFEEGFNDPDHPHHTLAYEGVSCTLCHQIEETNFGEESSFSGQFIIDTERPYGSRLAFGPYPSTEKDAEIMAGASGFLPEEASHVHSSELCAVCHTLYTPYVNEDGEVGGSFPEQVPYLEWKHSDFEGNKQCQDCHMPIAEGGVVLSTTSTEPRRPFFQHLFIGGNAYVLSIFHDHGEEIGVTASSDHLKRKIYDTLNQLQTNAATLTIDEIRLEDSVLKIDVSVENLAGHKLPTGFPSRRAWIHLVVEDGSGEVVFESGAYNSEGMIFENENDLDPEAYEDHYDLINQESQVQIYEAVLEDVQGDLTTVLLYASGYTKDNRLLPQGFDKETAEADIQVVGPAAEDEDFQGGGDSVTFVIEVDEKGGPFKVKANLVYQSIGYRWAVNLEGDQSPESALFLEYYEETPNWPVYIAGDEGVCEGE